MSQGTCQLCGGEFADEAMAEHLAACREQHPGEGPATRLLHLAIRDLHEPDYWLQVELPASLSLYDLDQFLRGLWLECCGHLSHFEVDGTLYQHALAVLGDEERDLSVAAGFVLPAAAQAVHVYDPPSPNISTLTVLGERTGPAYDPGVALLARNVEPVIACDKCEQRAAWVCLACDDGAWLCGRHAARHKHPAEERVPLLNSPRSGRCYYDGTAAPMAPDEDDTPETLREALAPAARAAYDALAAECERVADRVGQPAAVLHQFALTLAVVAPERLREHPPATWAAAVAAAVLQVVGTPERLPAVCAALDVLPVTAEALAAQLMALLEQVAAGEVAPEPEAPWTWLDDEDEDEGSDEPSPDPPPWQFPKATPGHCALCGKSFSRQGMTRHLQSCRGKQAGEGAPADLFHVVVEDAYGPHYWLHLELPARSTLGDLDGYLRDVWCECCGHLSLFDIDGLTYSSDPEPDLFLGDHSMRRRLDKVLRDGLNFGYEYDFGTSTDLNLRVVGRYRCPPLERGIVLLARNDPPDIRCAVCGEPATQVITDAEPWWAGWVCDAHAEDADEDMLLPVVNSPRTGLCGYVGPDWDDAPAGLDSFLGEARLLLEAVRTASAAPPTELHLADLPAAAEVRPALAAVLAELDTRLGDRRGVELRALAQWLAAALARVTPSPLSHGSAATWAAGLAVAAGRLLGRFGADPADERTVKAVCRSFGVGHANAERKAETVFATFALTEGALA